MSREIYLKDITEEVGDNIEKQIREWNEEDLFSQYPETIYMYINSNGGELDAALQIIDVMQLSKAPIVAINTSKAYSCGAFIFIVADERIAYPHSSFMIHEGLVELGERTADELRNYMKFYEAQLKQIREIITSKTDITEQELDLMFHKDWYFTAYEAENWKICDYIKKGGKNNDE